MLIKSRLVVLSVTLNMLLNGQKLIFVDKYKYFGIIIISSFMDDDDLARQMRSLYIRGNFSARNFRRNSDEIKSIQQLNSVTLSVEALYTLCSSMNVLQCTP